MGSILKKMLPLLLLAPLAACGGDLYAGGQGHVEAMATSDAEGTGGQSSRSASSQPMYTASPEPGPRTATAAALQGVVQFTASVALLDASGTEYPLAASVQQSVQIAGGDTVSLGGRDLPVQVYPKARITFTRVVASVESGLDLIPTGEFQVQIASGGSVVVERPVELLVRRDGSHAVVVDLNTTAWLVSAVGGVVPAAAFRSAVEVGVR